VLGVAVRVDRVREILRVLGREISRNVAKKPHERHTRTSPRADHSSLTGPQFPTAEGRHGEPYRPTYRGVEAAAPVRIAEVDHRDFGAMRPQRLQHLHRMLLERVAFARRHERDDRRAAAIDDLRQARGVGTGVAAASCGGRRPVPDARSFNREMSTFADPMSLTGTMASCRAKVCRARVAKPGAHHVDGRQGGAGLWVAYGAAVQTAYRLADKSG